MSNSTASLHTPNSKAAFATLAFAELKAANAIAVAGLRILNIEQRQQLAQLCIHQMPADGTIGYSFRRQEAINRMEAMRRIYLRDTIRHLKHCHKLIQITLRLMTPEQKLVWASANEQSGLSAEGATRAHERLAVVAQFEKLRDTFYPKPGAHTPTNEFPTNSK